MSHQTIVHNPFVPYDPKVLRYARWTGNTNVIEPWEYTNWIDETLSWKKTCYIHAFLSGLMANLRVKGPDAEKLMSETFVNSFSLDKFPVGSCKQVIACSEKGTITMNGIALRVAEDHFDTYCLDPQVPMAIASGKYNVEQYTPEYNKDFVYQLAGPKSLEIVENSIKQDIHGLKFMRFMYAEIAGCKIRVLRMGMGGTLAYEIHGSAEDAITVYNEIIRVGTPYGIRKLGLLAYMCNHTENGFPQTGTHFMVAFPDDPAIMKHFGMGKEAEDRNDQGQDWVSDPTTLELHGSMSDMGLSAYFSNPFEVGWGRLVNFDHEFPGKEALLKIAADPNTRKICTLEWNAEDLMQIYAGYYDEDKELPDPLVMPQEYYFCSNGNLADKVLDENGNIIGRSSGQIYTRYYKRTISLGVLDPAFCEEGKEVTILWGTNGRRQFKIRAKVARYPYLNLALNRKFDVESVPHYKPE